MTHLEFPQEIKDFKQVLMEGRQFKWEDAASLLFDFQSRFNPVYKEYLGLIGFDVRNPDLIEIPHLPITFFKNFEIKTGLWHSQQTFYSSSTTGKGRSAHHVRDIAFYNHLSQQIFETNFGSLKDKVILALLPGYIERGNSSLVHMVQHFMEVSGHPSNGSFLDQYEALEAMLDRHEEVILFGVPFALLAFIDKIKDKSLPGLTIIETGGMKGKGREMPRTELHSILNEALGPRMIRSEYGMTELLSQAYTDHSGRFLESNSLHISVKELNDPFQLQRTGKPGTLNLIDFANIDSCAFIETEDMAINHGDGYFEILGRIDNREIRGCNLLAI